MVETGVDDWGMLHTKKMLLSNKSIEGRQRMICLEHFIAANL